MCHGVCHSCDTHGTFSACNPLPEFQGCGHQGAGDLPGQRLSLAPGRGPGAGASIAPGGSGTGGAAEAAAAGASSTGLPGAAAREAGGIRASWAE